MEIEAAYLDIWMVGEYEYIVTLYNYTYTHIHS